MKKTLITLVATTSAALILGGCPTNGVPAGDPITLRVINDSDFDVDPAIEFGESDALLDALDVGILAPGESVDVEFNCEDIAVLTASSSTQIGDTADFVLDPLPLFQLDTDYFCGELIIFQFFGNGLDFEVQVDAGGDQLF